MVLLQRCTFGLIINHSKSSTEIWPILIASVGNLRSQYSSIIRCTVCMRSPNFGSSSCNKYARPTCPRALTRLVDRPGKSHLRVGSVCQRFTTFPTTLYSVIPYSATPAVYYYSSEPRWDFGLRVVRSTVKQEQYRVFTKSTSLIDRSGVAECGGGSRRRSWGHGPPTKHQD